MKDLKFQRISLIILLGVTLLSQQNNGIEITCGATMDNIQVLTIIHPDIVESEFFGVLDLLENLGCNVTYTGFHSVVLMGGVGLFRDISVAEVDVNDFDIFYMAGGWASQIISEGENRIEALNLVQDAFNNGLLMTSMCWGAYIFAVAEIVSGKQITGNSDLSTIITDAGGTYVDQTVVVDEPFITAHPGYYNKLVMSIAESLGYFEETPPTYIDVDIIKLEEDSFNISVEATDDSMVQEISIMFFTILANNQTTFYKNSPLEATENITIFSANIIMAHAGNYSLTASITDCYGNAILEFNIAQIEVNIEETETTPTPTPTPTPTRTNEHSTSSALTNTSSIIGLISVISLLSIVILRRKPS